MDVLTWDAVETAAEIEGEALWARLVAGISSWRVEIYENEDREGEGNPIAEAEGRSTGIRAAQGAARITALSLIEALMLNG